MSAKRSVLTITATALVGLSLVLSGCSISAGSGSADGSKARDAFLAERGPAGTPGVATATVTAGGPAQGTDSTQRVVMGKVEEIDESKLVVSDAMGGVQTTITVGDDTKVTKQVEAGISDIEKGDTVTASARRNGDVLAAEILQIGDTGLTGGAAIGGFVTEGAPGGPGGPGGPSDSSGLQPAPGSQKIITPGPGGDKIEATFDVFKGTVEEAQDGEITIKTNEGKSVTLQISDRTHVLKQEQAGVSDIGVGAHVLASGTDEGQEFRAQSLQLIGTP
jgi:hypothetical protein